MMDLIKSTHKHLLTLIAFLFVTQLANANELSDLVRDCMREAQVETLVMRSVSGQRVGIRPGRFCTGEIAERLFEETAEINPNLISATKDGVTYKVRYINRDLSPHHSQCYISARENKCIFTFDFAPLIASEVFRDAFESCLSSISIFERSRRNKSGIVVCSDEAARRLFDVATRLGRRTTVHSPLLGLPSYDRYDIGPANLSDYSSSCLKYENSDKISCGISVDLHEKILDVIGLTN